MSPPRARTAAVRRAGGGGPAACGGEAPWAPRRRTRKPVLSVPASVTRGARRSLARVKRRGPPWRPSWQVERSGPALHLVLDHGPPLHRGTVTGSRTFLKPNKRPSSRAHEPRPPTSSTTRAHRTASARTVARTSPCGGRGSDRRPSLLSPQISTHGRAKHRREGARASTEGFYVVRVGVKGAGTEPLTPTPSARMDRTIHMRSLCRRRFG